MASHKRMTQEEKDAKFLASVFSTEAVRHAERQLGIQLVIDMDSPNFEFILDNCPNTALVEDRQGGFCGRCGTYHWVWRKASDPNYTIQGGSWKSTDRYYSTPKWKPIKADVTVVDPVTGRTTLETQVTWVPDIDGDGKRRMVEHDRYKEAIQDRLACSYPIKVKSGRVVRDMGCLSFGDVPAYDGPMSLVAGTHGDFADVSADGSVWADLLDGADED